MLYDLQHLVSLGCREVLELDGIVAGNAHRHCAQLLISQGYSGSLEGDALQAATAARPIRFLLFRPPIATYDMVSI